MTAQGPSQEYAKKKTAGRRPAAGLNERSLSAALAEDADREPYLSALEGLAQTLARSVDLALGLGDCYAVAQLSARYVDALRELKLTPAVREAASHDALAKFFEEISGPGEVCDAP